MVIPWHSLVFVYIWLLRGMETYLQEPFVVFAVFCNNLFKCQSVQINQLWDLARGLGVVWTILRPNGGILHFFSEPETLLRPTLLLVNHLPSNYAIRSQLLTSTLIEPNSQVTFSLIR